MAFKDLSSPKLTFEAIEKLASENEELPNNMRLEDQSAFVALRSLYSFWRSGYLEHGKAKEEKRKIKLAYEKTKEVLGFYAEVYEYIQDNIRRSEAMRTRLLCDMRTGKDILADALLCIGYMRNDAAFTEAVCKHFGLEERR